MGTAGEANRGSREVLRKRSAAMRRLRQSLRDARRESEEARVESRASFREELTTLISRHSLEGGSNTPDMILSGYLADCLEVFDRTMVRREEWHGRAWRHVAVLSGAEDPS
jgi:hypothetical protein